ncbi:hypothetical protein [Ureaplasma canigenitalium]|uniref:hypothetical protein n=1 Tax=Ureaplasma canigenitalium TaxID=42092 RepID=UPI0004E1DDF3|nr:hypothetical protein [Ureaplasma canigenitalium]
MKKKVKHKDYYSLERHLRSRRGVLVSWLIIGHLIFLFSLGLGLSFHFLQSKNLDQIGTYIVSTKSDLVKATQIVIYVGLGVSFFPLAFLISCWITGINGVYTSTSFHIMTWFLLSLSFILMMISISLVVSIHIFI